MLQSIDPRILKGMRAFKTAALVRTGAGVFDIVEMAMKELPPYEFVDLLREVRDSSAARTALSQLKNASLPYPTFGQLVKVVWNDMKAAVEIRQYNPGLLIGMVFIVQTPLWKFRAYQDRSLVRAYDARYRMDLEAIANA